MTTMESPTTAARQTRNATEKTAETVKQDAHEVTEKADQMFQQQLPTADLAQGVERYFEFVQKAVDVNRELATNWADAVNSLSGVVREQAEKAGQLVTEQTEKVGERPTDKIGSATREQADKVDQGREEPGAALVASHQRPHQRSQQRAQRAFDRHQVGLHRTAPHRTTTPLPAPGVAVVASPITGLPAHRDVGGRRPLGRAHRSGAPRRETIALALEVWNLARRLQPPVGAHHP